jgi:hypothetical protein
MCYIHDALVSTASYDGLTYSFQYCLLVCHYYVIYRRPGIRFDTLLAVASMLSRVRVFQRFPLFAGKWSSPFNGLPIRGPTTGAHKEMHSLWSTSIVQLFRCPVDFWLCALVVRLWPDLSLPPQRPPAERVSHIAKFQYVRTSLLDFSLKDFFCWYY